MNTGNTGDTVHWSGARPSGESDLENIDTPIINLKILQILQILDIYFRSSDILCIDPEPGPQVSQNSRRRMQPFSKALSCQRYCFYGGNARHQVDKTLFSLSCSDFAVLMAVRYPDLRPCAGQVIASSPLPPLAHGTTSQCAPLRLLQRDRAGPRKSPTRKVPF